MQFDKIFSTSISSDDTLFDFDTILNKVKRLSGVDDQTFMRLTRTHFTKKFPHMSGVEHATVVAMFMIGEMNFKRFTETLDILGVKLTLGMDVPMGHLRKEEPKVDPAQAAIETFFKKPISSMELTVRLTNILEHSGKIATYGELVQTTLAKVEKIKGMGPKFLKELALAMKTHGLIFGMYTPEDQLAHLRISVRSQALLRESGFTHISQLCGVTEEDLLKIPGFRRPDVANVQSVLMTKGLSLKLRDPQTALAADPIELLSLPMRTTSCLKAENIQTIGDLLKRSEADILKVANFGRKSLCELKEVLLNKGLKLKSE